MADKSPMTPQSNELLRARAAEVHYEYEQHERAANMKLQHAQDFLDGKRKEPPPDIFYNPFRQVGEGSYGKVFSVYAKGDMKVAKVCSHHF